MGSTVLKTLTLSEVARRMKEQGMRISPATVADSIEQGIYSFGSMVKRPGNRYRKFIIYEVDFERWVAEKTKKS